MPDPYWRAKAIFAEALDRPSAERDGFVVQACGEDRRLFGDVRSLLAAHDRAVLTAPPLATAHTVSVPSEPPGTVIGPYTLIEPIGEGGMGIVHKAEQRAPFRRIVALKLIKLGMDTRQVIARFEAERQALAMMSHPNVAAVYDAGASDTGRPYFVMEYVPGTPITTFCDRHRYNTRQRLELFLQACDAIQHAHQKAIIHRDLKPGNILVVLEGGRPIVKVIDFGVAKATQQSLTERTLFTESGQLVGTPEYMSPEQADLNAGDVDTRTDIYSLGVVLYELLAGALPFDSRTLRGAAYAQIQAIIREVDPPRPSTRLSTMPRQAAADVASLRGTERAALERELRGELEWIPLKAMRKDRAYRYDTASQFAQDVRNYLDQRPLLAAPESVAYRARKFVRRNKAAVIGVSAVLLSLIGGVIGTTIGLVGQSRQRAIADAERVEAQRQAGEARRQQAIAEAIGRFQSDMLASANPDRLLGDKVTVLQVITAAVSDLDNGKLSDQPLVEASVRQTIGTTLRALGRFELAEPNVRKALELRRAALPANDPLVANSLGSLGLILQSQGRLGEAEPMLREAAEIRRGRGEPESLAVALNNLALLLDRQGKFADAEAIYRESLELRRAAHPHGDASVARSMSNLAAALYMQGKLAEAERMYRQAIEMLRRVHGDVHPALAPPLNNLAALLRSQGQFAEAESLAREALEIHRKTLPAQHPDTAKALVVLGGLLADQGKLDKAETMIREGIRMSRAVLPAGHTDIGTSLSQLGSLLQDRHRPAEAEKLYVEALEIHRGALPAGHPQIANDLSNLASLLRETGRFEQAAGMYTDAVGMLESRLGASHWRTAQARVGLGQTLTDLGRFAEAESQLLDAERALAAAQGNQTDRRANCVKCLLDLYEAWQRAGDSAAGEKLRQRRLSLPASQPATTRP